MTLSSIKARLKAGKDGRVLWAADTEKLNDIEALVACVEVMRHDLEWERDHSDSSATRTNCRHALAACDKILGESRG